MNKAIALISLFLFFLYGCGPGTSPGYDTSSPYASQVGQFYSLVEEEKEQEAVMLLDTIRVIEGVPDSVITKMEAKIQELRAVLDMREKARERLKELVAEEDEFQGVTFYRDKSAPKYENRNGIFLYFGVNKDGATTGLRFKIQYAAQDWVFVEKLIFLLDGETFEYTEGTWETDFDITIWEVNDSAVNEESFELINKIISSKEAKVRFVGSKRVADKEITRTQKEALERVLGIYEGLMAR